MTPKQTLARIAEALEEQAVEMSVHAAALHRRSAQVEQVARLLTDEQADETLRELMREGLIEIVDVDALDITGPGGDA